MDLVPGRMVGDYARLLRPLGEGGMGTVWVAHHLRLDTEVAVKVIADPSLRKDAGLMERLRREARAAARIGSPHVVHVYDHGSLPDGSPFLLMELLKGESLGDRIARDHVIHLTLAADIVRQAAAALSAAHALGIVHRDIKPDNIFLCGDPNRPFVKVLDFGIALRHGIDNPDPRLTTADRLVGTPSYMSPELLLSTDEPGPAADIWALAVTAYEMLCGALPHEGATLTAILMAVTGGQHIPPRRARPALPGEADTWFARALAVDVRERFQSAEFLAETFSHLCDTAAKALAHVHDEYEMTMPADSSPVGDGSATIPEDGGPTIREADGPIAMSQTLMETVASSPATFAPHGGSAPAQPHAHAFTPQRGYAPQSSQPGAYAVPSAGVPSAGVPSTSHPATSAAPTSAQQRVPTMGGAAAPARDVPKKARWPAVLGGLLVLGGIGAAVAWFQLNDESKPKAVASARPSEKAKKPPDKNAEKNSPPPEERDLPRGMTLIPGGTYTIGCDTSDSNCNSDEGPVHQVEVKAFAIMTHEVTNAQYAACVDSKQCLPLVQSDKCTGTAGSPVRCLGWRAAGVVCTFLEGRLPTEVEWEIAARGKSNNRFPWGDAPPTCDLTVMRGCGQSKPIPGGVEKDRSAFGVFNLAGNVREWTSSPYGAYPGGEARNAAKNYRITRGGSYAMDSDSILFNYARNPDDPSTEMDDLGVRCAKSL